MRKLFVTITSSAFLIAGMSLIAVRAQDTEVKGPVPNRADASNPQSEVYRASDVMNMPVKDENGAEIGHIKDLVINGESREVLYAVVSMNNAKEKDAFYVMPWTVFQPAFGRGDAIQYTVLTVPQNIWIQAPFYTSAQWRTVAFADWGPKVHNYYEQHIHTNANSTTRSKTYNVNKPGLNREDNKGSRDDKQGAPAKDTDKPKPRDNQNSDADKPKPRNNPSNDADQPKPRPKTEPQQPNDKPSPKGNDSANDSAKPAPKEAGPKQPDPAPKSPAPEPKSPAPNPK